MSQSSREVKRRYEQSEKGKAAAHRARVSPAGKARALRYYYTAKGKEAQRRYNQSEKGKARLARGVHKRRAAMAILSTLTAEEWAAIKERQGQRCLYCNQVKPLTMDHLLPLSKGGVHTAENVVAACLSCNSKRGNRAGT